MQRGVWQAHVNRMRALGALIVVLWSGPASADYTEMAPVRPLTMSDPSGLTNVGLEVQGTRWTETPPPPASEIGVTSLTLDVAADIRLAPHWMILARLPMSDVSTDDDDPATDECCDFALGNLTLGGRGLWSTRLDSGTRAVAGGELSVSLPTASDGSERGGSASAAALARLPHDPGRYAPSTTTARFTMLGQLYSRWFVAHAETGLQLYFYDGDVPGDDDLDVAVRLALAAGFRVTYTLALMAELSSLLLYSNKFAGGNDTVTSLDFGIRYGSGVVTVGLRAYLPIDSELRDLDMLGVGLDVGLRF